MRLDHSFIRIRSRSLLEIFDLALQVLRRYPASLLGYLITGAIGWAVLNALLVSGYDGSNSESGQSSLSGSVMLLLVMAQAPLGTLWITSYLGQAMFVERPSFSSVWRTIRTSWPALIWLQGIVRASLPITGLLALSGNSQRRDDGGLEIFLVIILLLWSLTLKVFRPYASEVILLEKTPLRQKPGGPIAFGPRNRMLHRHITSDSFSLLLLSAVFGASLLFVLYGSLCLLFELAGLVDDQGQIRLQVIWPVTLWLVSGFLAIVRFLAYIDTRIRQEGWEVELRIRAEASKLETEGVP